MNTCYSVVTMTIIIFRDWFVGKNVRQENGEFNAVNPVTVSTRVIVIILRENVNVYPDIMEKK